MELSKIKKVHIIGVGGIGISAVAKYLLQKEKVVTGSDINDSDIISVLKSFGGDIKIGEHKTENVTKDCDLVIYTDAVPETNPERIQAGKLNIETLSYFQFLGEFSKTKYTIAISGTHGKTTTTAMTGLILEKANFDPTVIVGSKIKNWDGNLKIGASKNFVVEADEYKAHMVELDPNVIIINNIEFEHTDYYRDINHVIEKFQEFINKLPSDGYFIYNLDDPILRERIEKPNCNVVSYGIEQTQADLTIKNSKVDHGRQIFKPIYKGKELKDFNLQIPGKFNISNALAASLVALELGVDQDAIKDTLSQYIGAWRRFEKVGVISNLNKDKNGAIIISDYAHHPTEVASTIQAAHEFYPEKDILVVFQPHQQQRTKELFDDFVKVFTESKAKKVILTEVYDVAGRQDDVKEKVSSRELIDKITLAESNEIAQGKIVQSEYFYAKDLKDTKAEILNQVKSNNVVLILGAGDIDSVARELI